MGYKTTLVYIQGEGTAPTAIRIHTGATSNPIHVNVQSNRLSLAEGLTMQSAEFFTVGGARVLLATLRSEVSFAHLGRGIYLARVRTDRGAFEKLVQKND